MRLMQPARNFTNAVVLSLIVLGLGTVMLTADQEVLDLRKTPLSARRSMGVPGSAAGGTLGMSESGLLYELPVRVKIRKLSSSNDILTVTLELLNIGNSRLAIPSCLDQEKAHGANALDRRSLQFGLIFQPPRAKPTVPQLLDVTFGSASRPNCSVPLEPGGSVIVIAETRLPTEMHEFSKESAPVLVKAFVSELKLKDGEYYIEQRSRRLESEPVELPPNL